MAPAIPGRALSARPRSGHHCWEGVRGRAHFRFFGKPADGPRETVEPEAPATVAWVRQHHSTTVVAARPGDCGPGDALFTARADLALRIVTADCVPVLLLGDDIVAAIHAGWRGIAAGIVPAAVERAREHGALEAVIGPAIGPCCYEVGEDVAAAVGSSSTDDVIVTATPGRRPHLDLPGAVRHQLAATGLVCREHVDLCTRCERERLWSYRREGPAAGRNVAFVWLSG